MPHDKIKRAARARMARTGESYMVARLKVIEEHRSKAGSPPQQDRAADVQMAGLRAGIAQFERNIRAAKLGPRAASRPGPSS